MSRSSEVNRVCTLFTKSRAPRLKPAGANHGKATLSLNANVPSAATDAGTLDIFLEQNNIDTSSGNEAPFTQNKTMPATAMYIVKGISVAQGTSLVVLDHPLYLMETTKFKAKANAASVLQLTMSYEVINTIA